MIKFAKTAKFTAGLIDKISGMGGVLAGAAIVTTMLGICFDVFMRYVFIRPTKGADEVTGYLLVMTVFIAAAYVLREDGHVRVDMILEHLPQKARIVLDILTSLLALVFCGLVAWQGWAMVLKSYDKLYASVALHLPLWIPQSLIFIGFVLLGLQFVVRTSRSIKQVYRGTEGRAD